jgi:signal recognition particle receptor subunit beta
VSSSSEAQRRSSRAPAAAPPTPVKVVIAGGFGVGKTTMVASISDIPPLTTEGHMTTMATGLDDRSVVAAKTSTTVAMDFGRARLEGNINLYLFGTPGQDRFGFMWDNLVRGALGAIVLVDTRRIDDCYPAVDFFENRDVPFIVGVNQFEGQELPSLADVRWALDLAESIPIVMVDARNRISSLDALLVLLLHNMKTAESRSDPGTASLGRSRLIYPPPLRENPGNGRDPGPLR